MLNPCTDMLWVALYSVIFGKFHGLKVDILGTQSQKFLRVKGLQTGLFKGSWLPNVNINWIILQYNDALQVMDRCNGWKVWSNGTTSVPRLVLDKVRQVLVAEVPNSNVYVQLVPNKSHSQELNNVLFVVVVSLRPIFTVTLIWNTKKLVT